MKAALVTGPGQIPVYGDFQEPRAQAGHELITVTASALSPATRSLAAGSHYSSSNNYPVVVGIDGVGRTQNGQRVYFVRPQAPFGGMAEHTLVPTENCFPLPDHVDDMTVAAIANPGLSSVAALKARALLRTGETVLINGATGSAGTLAVQIAKYLGAKKVIATGRDAASLQRVKQLGADVTIDLLMEPKDIEEAFAAQFRGGGVDIVLDYLFGPNARMLLTAIAMTYEGSKPIRYVVVGGITGAETLLPSAVLRAAPIALMGSGIGSVPWKGLIEATQNVIQAITPADLHISTLAIPLDEVERTWNAPTGKARVVFVAR